MWVCLHEPGVMCEFGQPAPAIRRSIFNRPPAWASIAIGPWFLLDLMSKSRSPAIPSCLPSLSHLYF
jgi:hypothetical protein